MEKEMKKRDRKRILYIMGIDWNWIHQRPQILAELLMKDYDVTVLYPRSILKICKSKGSNSKLTERILWTIPLQEKNAFIGKLSEWLNKRKTADIKRFDYVFVGYPLYARYIPDDYAGRIIYDCMDNHRSLYPDQKRVWKVVSQEEKLIRRSALLVASASELQKNVNQIARIDRCQLVRNGVEIEKLHDVKHAAQRDKYLIGYIGTIAEWFDYDLLVKNEDVLRNIEYHLIGPYNNKIKNGQIYYEGVVAHSDLYQMIKDYDCLIMPFIVNDIVAAVDPVKLYEYIAFGKCIVSVYYPEIERFGEFVYFYHDADEYRELMQKLSEEGFPAKYDEQQQKRFIQENTWQERYIVLKNYINAMEENNK